MSNSVFRKTYADQYDLLYTVKAYEAECNHIKEVIRKYGNGEIEASLFNLVHFGGLICQFP